VNSSINFGFCFLTAASVRVPRFPLMMDALEAWCSDLEYHGSRLNWVPDSGTKENELHSSFAIRMISGFYPRRKFEPLELLDFELLESDSFHSRFSNRLKYQKPIL
jgi:hypothetical protein